MNNAKEKQLEALASETISSTISSYLEKVKAEEKKLKKENSDKYFWQRNNNLARTEELVAFKNTPLPSQLEDNILRSENEIERSFFDVRNYSYHKQEKEKEIYRDWIKASLIIDGEKNKAYQAIITKGAQMESAIKNLTLKDSENQKMLRKGKKDLQKTSSDLKKLKETKAFELARFYDDRVREMNNNTTDLKMKVIIAESEAAKILFELDNTKDSLNRERSINDLTNTSHLNEINQLKRDLASLEQSNKDYQNVIRDCRDQIEDLLSDKKRITNNYNQIASELNDANHKLAHHNSFNQRFYRAFDNQFTTFSNLGKISLLLLILFFILKFLTKLVSLFKKLFTRKKK